MKSQFSRCTVLACLFTLALALGQAQSFPALHIHAPFAFVAGGARLPAGDYTISETTDSGVILIAGRTSALVMTMPLGPEIPSPPAVTFGIHNGERRLVSLRLPGSPIRALRIPSEPKLP